MSTGIQAFLHTGLFHRETVAQNNFYICFFGRKKDTFDRNRLVHADRTKRTDFFFLAPKILPSAALLHSTNFSAQKPLGIKTCAQQVLQTTGFHTRKIPRTEVLRTEGFAHSIFYIQLFLHADAFTQTHTHTHCTQKLVHTARLHTANFCAERLCFPSYITCPLRSCSQVFLLFVWQWFEPY